MTGIRGETASATTASTGRRHARVTLAAVCTSATGALSLSGSCGDAQGPCSVIAESGASVRRRGPAARRCGRSTPRPPACQRRAAPRGTPSEARREVPMPPRDPAPGRLRSSGDGTSRLGALTGRPRGLPRPSPCWPFAELPQVVARARASSIQTGDPRRTGRHSCGREFPAVDFCSPCRGRQRSRGAASPPSATKRVMGPLAHRRPGRAWANGGGSSRLRAPRWCCWGSPAFLTLRDPGPALRRDARSERPAGPSAIRTEPPRRVGVGRDRRRARVASACIAGAVDHAVASQRHARRRRSQERARRRAPRGARSGRRGSRVPRRATCRTATAALRRGADSSGGELAAARAGGVAAASAGERRPGSSAARSPCVPRRRPAVRTSTSWRWSRTAGGGTASRSRCATPAAAGS